MPRSPTVSLNDLRKNTVMKTDTLHDPISPEMHAPLRNDLPDWDNMTDEEIMAAMAQDQTEDKYAVQNLAPDGMWYQWVRCEVFGKPDHGRVAEVEAKGWRPVPQKRHDGRFMPPGTDGPIQMDGQMLFEIPHRVARIKRELASRVAREKVDDMNAQLAYSPPGTGPRVSHKQGAPMVRRESGSTAMQMVVE